MKTIVVLICCLCVGVMVILIGILPINTQLSRLEQEMRLHKTIAVAERGVLAEIVAIQLSNRIDGANRAIQEYASECAIIGANGIMLTDSEKEERGEHIGLRKEQFETWLEIIHDMAKRGKVAHKQD